MSSDLIAALDNGLARVGEDIILRRVFGTAPNQTAVDVKCRAKVTATSAEPTVAGIPATTFDIIMSPTQIREAQWPGGSRRSFRRLMSTRAFRAPARRTRC
jgi:hypothetical protein